MVKTNHKMKYPNTLKPAKIKKKKVQGKNNKKRRNKVYELKADNEAVKRKKQS